MPNLTCFVCICTNWKKLTQMDKNSKKPDRNRNIPIRGENDTGGETENTMDEEGLIT